VNPDMKKFIARHRPVYDTVARLDVDQELREEIARRLADALDEAGEFKPGQRDTFELLASDPLVPCAGNDIDGACPADVEIRVGMHWSGSPDGRSQAWERERPEVRCLDCGSKQFIPEYGDRYAKGEIK
jgi:hypothetical protein